MFDYEVRFVWDSVNVVTYVVADDEDYARRLAEIQVYDSTGFDMISCVGVWIEKVGEFV